MKKGIESSSSPGYITEPLNKPGALVSKESSSWLPSGYSHNKHTVTSVSTIIDRRCHNASSWRDCKPLREDGDIISLGQRGYKEIFLTKYTF